MWAALGGHRLHLELHLWCCFSCMVQRSCHQQHHPQVLWPLTSCDNTSQCLTGRPWCSTPAKWQTHGFCEQGLYQKPNVEYANIEREMLAAIFGMQRDSECMSTVGLSPSSQTTSPWNPSPRRIWQTCQPVCSACYCTSRAMIAPSVTAPVKKWPYLTHSLSSVHVLDPTSHWTSPSTMLTCP